MPVRRYRSIDEMPPPWRSPDDPGNLRLVAMMLAFHRRWTPREKRSGNRVRRFRSVEEAQREDSG